MEKRLLLAVVLMTAVIMFTNILLPPPEPAEEVAPEPVEEEAPAAATTTPGAVTLPSAGIVDTRTAPDSVIVESGLYRYVFSTRGGALVRAELLTYPSYTLDGAPAQVVPDNAEFLSQWLVVGTDTVPLSTLPFTPNELYLRLEDEQGAASLDFEYEDESGFGVRVRHTFRPDGYLVSTQGAVVGVEGREALLLTRLESGIQIHEHPDHHSERELAVVSHGARGVDREAMRRFEGTSRLDPGLTWVGVKDKYFLAALIAGSERPFSGGVVTDVPDLARVVNGDEIVAPQVDVTAESPIVSGQFAYDWYLGPQDYGRLSAIGYDLEEVTPYGYRWLQPIIRPLAAAVLWVLNTLHDTLGIAYGWVLVIFGVMMRIVLWPLNAKAMRAQMKNMGVQPLLQEIREKYKDDPQQQQAAMLSLYKEHGFNPFAGCLPLLVPFPVLITLFFVFQNTIAFRGAEFLWLPDLSLRDPFYILPFVLVVSMFALQWVSAHLSGMEQNPQMKMMMYFMPIMMGVIFFMLPAGLNLYYAVTQVASIPQQVLIARERKAAQEELKRSSSGPKLPSSTASGSRKRKQKPKR